MSLLVKQTQVENEKKNDNQRKDAEQNYFPLIKIIEQCENAYVTECWQKGLISGLRRHISEKTQF